MGISTSQRQSSSPRQTTYYCHHLGCRKSDTIFRDTTETKKATLLPPTEGSFPIFLFPSPPPPTLHLHRTTDFYLLPKQTIMRSALCTAAAVLLLGVSSFAQDTRPNVVIFMPDDMKFLWDEAPAAAVAAGETRSSNGGTLPTPNMDRIRDEGAVFTRAYTAAPKCTPSRFSLLTGRDPARSEFGIASSMQGAEPDWDGRVTVGVPQTKMDGADLTRNLPTELKAEGYATIHAGKWHLFAGGPSEQEYLQDYSKLVAEVEGAGFTSVAAAYVSNMQGGGATTDGEISWSHNHEWVVASALESVGEAVEAEKPFFLYMTPTGPHGPDTEEALFEYSPRATPSGMLAADPVTTMRSRADLWAAAGEATLMDQENAAGHMWVDDMLGALLQGLEDLEVLDNTFVVLCTDHGTEAKSSVDEGGARIMQAVRYPPSVSAGHNVVSVVANPDTSATVLDLLGVDASYSMDGRSWLTEATRGRIPRRTVPKFVSMTTDRAVLVGDWKYMDGALYNLALNPLEDVDLSGVAEHSAKLEEMALMLACHDLDTSALSDAVCSPAVIQNDFNL